MTEDYTMICPLCKFRMVRIPVGNYQDPDFGHQYVILTKCANPFCKASKHQYHPTGLKNDN